VLRAEQINLLKLFLNEFRSKFTIIPTYPWWSKILKGKIHLEE